MAPFPETEIMTIKRLEVALRKMDLKLLKDGAYKLHEKYHGGYKFEYLDLLKEIFMEVSNNASIPNDIKDILAPTIEDILSQQGISTDTSTSPYEALNQNRVSSLTSLSYNPNNTEENNQHEPKINAFDAFGTKSDEKPENQNKISYSQSPFSAKPFEEFSMNTQTTETKTTSVEVPQAENETPIAQETLQTEEKAPNKKKNIAIFYGQDNSNEKKKNILNFKKLISNSQNGSIEEILKLLCEINTQTDTNVSELKNLFEQLQKTQHKLSLTTNVSSKYLISLFEDNNFSYSFKNNNQEAQTKLIPIFGLSNLFVCKNCKEKYLNKNSEISSLILECPKCKSPMFPDFYSNQDNGELNLDYYSEALISLANSEVWFIVHPVMEEKAIVSLLSNALKLNTKIKDIFILDKDINTRENFRSLFSSINPEVKINIQMSALEDFLNLVR